MGRFLPFLHARCITFPRNLVVLSDGTVTTCCNDNFGESALGSLYSKDISDIWKGPVRTLVKNGLAKKAMCLKCHRREISFSFLKHNKNHISWLASADGYPYHIDLEIMAACNYDCCVSNELKNRRPVSMDLNLVFKNISSFLPKLKSVQLHGTGESILHPGFCGFVEKLRTAAPSLEMIFSTNGMRMDERIARCLVLQRVDMVFVSAHGGPLTENLLKYAKRGADYEVVLENTRRLIELRNASGGNKPLVELKAILFNWNDTDELMERLRQDGKRIGVDRVCWYLDWDTSGLRPSKRFTRGNRALQELEQRGEYYEHLNKNSWNLFRSGVPIRKL